MRPIRSRLPLNTQHLLIRLFVDGETAKSAAEIADVQQNTASLYYGKIRKIIFEKLREQARSIYNNEHVIDLACVDVSSPAKIPMIGIWRRSGRIMSRIIIRKSTNADAYNGSTKVAPDLIIYLVKTKSSRQINMNELHWERYGEQLEDRLPEGDEGPLVEDFWMYTKMVLRRYKGIKVANFDLYLKECEFRFNYSSGDKKITILEEWCLPEYLR